MSAGVGIDVVSVSRVAALVERRPAFIDRVYTAAEQAACAGLPRRWATRWAAKEAVRKLFGSAALPMPAFRAVEVGNGADGEPWLRAHGAASALALSLSDTGDLAVAVVTGTPGAATHVPVPADVHLAPRPADAHKGTFGTVLVVGGAVGFSGAPVMSATAAARAGAGKVRVAVPDAVHMAVAAQTLEVMAHPVASSEGGLAAEALPTLHRLLEDTTCAVIGPGVGRAGATETAILTLLGDLRVAAVVDADALNIAAANGFDWRRCAVPLVLTPHPAEMGRLCSISTADVQRRRTELAVAFAARSGTVVVLKGAETVVAEPRGRVHVSTARTVALASGGSGDVLSGVIAAFIAQGLAPFDAAVAGVFVHAEAAVALEMRLGRAGVLPRDLIDELPAAQERTRRMLESRAAG